MNANRMHSDSGYIKLYRRITEWRWYSDPVMFRVFVHLLLTANHGEGEWRDITVKRGQRVTSVSHLAAELGYSKDTIQKALKRLVDSGEITRTPNARYTILTVNNYDEYQDNRTLNERQTNDSRTTAERAPVTIKEEKEEKEKKEGQKSTYGRTENAFSENSFSENPVRENAIPEKPKNERIQQNTVSRYSTEKEKELQKSLNERYGKEIVELYEQRFRQWSLKKGAAVPMYQTIEKWIERDGIKPLCERGTGTHSSLDAEKIDRQILEFYK